MHIQIEEVAIEMQRNEFNELQIDESTKKLSKERCIVIDQQTLFRRAATSSCDNPSCRPTHPHASYSLARLSVAAHAPLLFLSRTAAESLETSFMPK